MNAVNRIGANITVVGGGIGGLSAACYLADAGADVTLLEQHDHLGGVAGSFDMDGFRFDLGPSWYLMPDVFERFFAAFGRSVDDAYELERLDPSYRILWKDGDRLDVPADPEALAPKLEAYEDGAAGAFRRYLDRAEEVYELAMDRFVYPFRSGWTDWIDTDLLRSARALPLLRSMAPHVQQYFDHPKLRQLMEYKLVFLGGSPYNTPALYTLMGHVDFNQGVWHPRGGMQSLVDGIAEVATDVAETSLLVLYFTFVPMMVAVGLYFPLWYTLRQTARTTAISDADPAPDRLSLPLTWVAMVGGALVTFALAAGFYVLVPNPLGGAGWLAGAVAFYTVFVCILALPHIVVGEWLDRARGISYVP
jgi:hypothetical protein